MSVAVENEKSVVASYSFSERLLALPIPDFILRYAIKVLLKQRLRQERRARPAVTTAVSDSSVASLATHTVQSLQQHYAVDTRFFRLVLGEHLKYSCALFCDDSAVMDLSEAELAMLDLYCKRAELKNQQEILELGCGWGSLSLYLAQRYPGSSITTMSHSASQADYIRQQAKLRKLDNICVITADINQFDPANYGFQSQHFDRVLSIEMIEHTKNQLLLMQRIRQWVKPSAKIFIHHFAHKSLEYDFNSDSSWMAKHFFSGGKMLRSDSLSDYLESGLAVVKQWHVNGRHYHRTCELWHQNLIKNKQEILAILAATPKLARLRYQYWKLFFLACSELFAFNDGNEWRVEHVLLQPTASAKESL